MAYNYYPTTYATQYYPQPQTQTAQQSNSIIWVQGEAGAKSYLVAPNTSVALWDSESQTIYIKSADASGMPSMRILDYSFRNEIEVAKTPLSNGYATRDDIDSLRAELKELREKIESEAEK